MNLIKITSGFTLIELIMVLAIISILSVVSFPLYHDHLLRTRRLYIITMILELAGRMEKYYIINNTYDGANSEAKLSTNNSSYKDYYKIEFTPQGDFYTLKAIPQGNQTHDSCGTLILDQTGNKSVSGGEDATKCWS